MQKRRNTERYRHKQEERQTIKQVEDQTFSETRLKQTAWGRQMCLL